MTASEAGRGTVLFSVILAVVHGAAATAWAVVRGPAFNPDGVSYAALARSLLAGDARSLVNAFWSPAYPISLALPLALGLDVFDAARWVAIGAGAATIPVFLRLGETFGLGAGVVRVAACLLLLSPIWIPLTPLATPDILVVPVFTLYLVRFVRLSREPALRTGAAAGLVAGLLFLVRTYMFFLGLAALPVALFRAPRGRRAAAAAGYLAAFLAAAGPWILAMRAGYGRFTIGAVGALNRRVEVSGAYRDDPPRAYPWFYLPSGPWNLIDYAAPGSPLWRDPPPGREITAAMEIRGIARQLPLAIRFLANPGGGLVLCLAATALAASGLLRPSGIRLSLLSACLVGGFCLVRVTDRYLLPVLVPVFLGAAAGLERLARRPRLQQAAVALLTAVAVLQGYRRTAQPTWAHEAQVGRAVRQAGKEIARSGRGPLAVLTPALQMEEAGHDWSRALAVAYFADAPLAALEHPDPIGTRALQQAGVRWVVSRRTQPCARFLGELGWRLAAAFGPFGSEPGFELWEAPPPSRP